MAAPTPTARQTPSGFKMPDGFKTLVTLANKPAIQLWEKGVKPPGLDGGAPIETTTMHNIRWRTMDTRSLITLDPCTFKAAFDPDMISDLYSQIDVIQAVTITFPDHSTLAFWGFLQKVEFDDMEEGKFPEVSVTINPTNWSPSDHVEAAPVFTAATGT